MSSHVPLDPAEQSHSGDSVSDMTLGKRGTRDLSMGVGGKKSHISKMTASHQLMPCDKGVLLGLMSFCRDTLRLAAKEDFFTNSRKGLRMFGQERS